MESEILFLLNEKNFTIYVHVYQYLRPCESSDIIIIIIIIIITILISNLVLAQSLRSYYY